MKNLYIILALVVSTSVFAQNTDFCVNIAMKENSKTVKYQKVKYLPADNRQIKEEHTKADYFIVSDYITLGNCGEEEICCFDTFEVLKKETGEIDNIFDTELYVIVFDKKANIITIYVKTEKLYYQYKVSGECNF
jgi:hypothetical protein